MNGVTIAKSRLPAHIRASGSAMSKIKAICETSKTTRVHGVVIGDSNAGTFQGCGSKFERDNFPRMVDRGLSFLRANTDAYSIEDLREQTQVIHYATWGLAKANATADLPWHPEQKKLIGDYTTILGPFAPYSHASGACIFTGTAVADRFIGFIVDRTTAGKDWERTVTRAAVRFAQATTGQTVSQGQTAPNGTAWTGGNYTGPCSAFTMDFRDVSGIDFSTIPATGWDAADAACIAIKAAITAIAPYASQTITSTVGGGAPKGGVTSAWLDGISSGIKTLVSVRVANGNFMGTSFTSLILDDNSRTGGLSIYDSTSSGKALRHLEWIRCDTQGVDTAGFSSPNVTDFQTSNYVMVALAAHVLMYGENTYARSGFFGGFSGLHNILGLDFVVISLSTNDIANSGDMPIVLYRKLDEALAQIVAIKPNCVVFIVACPCPAADPTRDAYFTGTNGARASHAQFVAEMQRAADKYSGNTVFMNYQQRYGNVAPMTLKGRIGHFARYMRDATDPIDLLHYTPQTFTNPVAADIAQTFQMSYSY